MANNVKWYPKKFTKKLDTHLDRNLDLAAEYLQANIQKAFPGRGGKPSKSGEIPTVQTGNLKRSIRWERSAKKFVRKIGSILKGYPTFLEFGTRKMAKRPYLRPALGRTRSALMKLIGRKMV